jgi:hypothetical protein
MKITTFPDVHAKTKAEHDMTWPALVSMLDSPANFATKAGAPLLKLGTFGDRRAEKSNCLRFDDNMLVITGIEGDYDGEQVAPTEAIERLERHGIRACVYTSPSHTDGKPRWRVLAPLSTELPKGQRDMLVRRLNGALGGILTSESFTDSQTYYYGRVNGHPYACLVTFDDPEDGQCINELPKLDEIAIGKPKSSGPKLGGRYGAEHADAEKLVDLRSALAAISSDDYPLCVKMGLALYPLGDPGHGLWTEYLQKSAKYDPRWGEEKWQTFSSSVSGSSVVFAEAKARGWINPRSSVAQRGKATTRAQGAGSTEWKPNFMSAAELLQTEFAPIRWIIQDILPEGLFILAARPKIGKSWLAMQTVLGVGSGADVLNRRTSKGEALYLALEDNPRRIKSRLLKYRAGYLADQSALARVTFVTEWKLADDGGIEALYEWLDAHPQARLIVIDTLEKFRARRTERGNQYGEDYAALQTLKAICDTRQISIVVVHHTRKAEADDPIDSISGTLGLGGAADGALVLTRRRGSEQAELHLIGRDIPGEGAYAVRFDRLTCLWGMEGKASEVAKTRERQDILDVLTKRGAMKPIAIAEELDRPRAAVRKMLRRMLDDNEVVQSDDGTYSIYTHVSQGTESTGVTGVTERAGSCDTVTL